MEPAQNVDITIKNTGIYGGSMKYGDKMLKMPIWFIFDELLVQSNIGILVECRHPEIPNMDVIWR
jgi:hypothetical protein